MNLILQVEDAQTDWRELINVEEQTLVCFAPLLQRCGVWGCILGATLAAKLARYVHHHNMTEL